jgi:LuxR family maltose regulon positive regulatory protein
MPLTFRGALNPILDWLQTLPTEMMDQTPLLWVTWASAELGTGSSSGVEEKLQAAEVALQSTVKDDANRDLIGRIAATRATMAWGQDDADTIIDQSERALEYLHPDNLPFQTSTAWKLASAYHLKGDREAAMKAYAKTIVTCEESGNLFIHILALTGMGEIQVEENQLLQAAETYRRILQLVGEQPLAVACGAHLGLGKILYLWNDLEAAQRHTQIGADLARRIESTDAYALGLLGLAQLELAAGDPEKASMLADEADLFVAQHNFPVRVPDIVSMKVRALLQKNRTKEAAQLAKEYGLSPIKARVYLAQGETKSAWQAVKTARQEAESAGRQDKLLESVVLTSITRNMLGEVDQALQALLEALQLAQPAGIIRIFIDEGPAMAHLLRLAFDRGMERDYVQRLLDAFDQVKGLESVSGTSEVNQSGLIEPLSERELEVLELIAEGLTNKAIGERLYLSLNTVKVHTRNIYGKLGVNNRTQAVAKSRELGLLPL